MKLSLKFRNNNENQQTPQTQIMTAKVPITIFNNPLISTITATGNTTSDFSFSLSTNYPSGPTFKLSYSPTSSLPFSLSLKSGLGFFGSPHHSPLVFNASFSLSNISSSTPLLPSFSLHLKPQFGHFSLDKTVFSDPNPNPNTDTKNVTDPVSLSPRIEKGFVPVPDGSCSGWQNLNLEPFGHKQENDNVVAFPESKNNVKCGLDPFVGVMARTVLPVTHGLSLNFRWGVNFPGKSGLRMPCLTVNKIGLERVEEVKNDELKLNSNDFELEIVEKENKELKRVLDELKMEVCNHERSNLNVGNKLLPKQHEKSNSNVGNKLLPKQHSGESESFQSWRSNKNSRQENEKKQPKLPNNDQKNVVMSDLESELEKAIKAASS